MGYHDGACRYTVSGKPYAWAKYLISDQMLFFVIIDYEKATTNPSSYELLEPYCLEVVQTRIVRDGHIFTAGGVSSSIDLGLYLVEFLVSPEFAEITKQSMDYPYYELGKYERNDQRGNK
jgi:hypothetical protein